MNTRPSMRQSGFQGFRYLLQQDIDLCHTSKYSRIKGTLEHKHSHINGQKMEEQGV